MAISDEQFRLGVLVGGVALVAGISVVRFCGSVSIPEKPAPSYATGTQSQAFAKSTASQAVYLEYLAKDAAAAGVRTPTIEDMSRKLTYRVDEARHVLEVGQPAIEIAGVRLELLHENDMLVLDIRNTTTADLAYLVSTEPSPNLSSCNTATPLAFNAIVIGAGKTERRVECVFRDDMGIVVTKVETLEVSPISGWMLGLVPPTLIGLDSRTSRGHRGGVANETCASVVSQAVRSGLEKGQIGWRDLVDFYARHRCPTYRFPFSYKAFKSDGEQQIPVVDSGM
ncbi:MAG: hypothetical protein ACKV2T_11290 [Kofleriaceae bacterium]